MESGSRSGIFFWIAVCLAAWILYFVLTPLIWRWEARVKARVYLEELRQHGETRL